MSLSSLEIDLLDHIDLQLRRPMIYLRTALVAVAAWLVQIQTSFASPFCLPPGAPDAGVMRAAPEECLFYLGWNGAGTADPKSANQTEQLLAESEVRQFLSQVET